MSATAVERPARVPDGMRRELAGRVGRAAWRAGRAELRKNLANPGGLVVSGLFLLVVAGMLAALWSAAAEANGGAVAGYTAAALVWYVTISEITTISQRMQFIDELGDDIGSGRVETALLRPVPMVVLLWAAQVGGALPRLAACCLGGLPLAAVIAGAPPSWPAAALAIPATLLAVTINITGQHVFAAAAFWLRNARATWFVYQKLVFVLGGMLLPLEVLPDWLESIAQWLPFMAMAYVPARLAAGYVEPELLFVQAFWLVALATIAIIVFARGERRLVEAGA